MPGLVLVTDSSADLPAEVVADGGIIVVPATFAFEDHAMPDGEMGASAFYERMRQEAQLPRPFGVPEASFRKAFERVFAEGNEPVCIVAPFDVNPSFTTASAAMLSLDDVDMKVVNPGVASAGLCSLLVTLQAGIRSGWSRQELLDRVDELAPLSDAIFAPEEVDWLERSGRLRLIEEKLGEIGDGVPVVRVGTRITGVALAESAEGALKQAVLNAGKRAGGQRVVVTISHAAAEERARQATELARDHYDVARLLVTELSATVGSQLGPGAIGVGVAPAID